MSSIRIVVELDGGLVSNVFSPDWPDAEVCIVDYDLEGADDDDPASSTGPVDNWESVCTATRAAVEALQGGGYLTVGELKEIIDNE